MVPFCIITPDEKSRCVPSISSVPRLHVQFRRDDGSTQIFNRTIVGKARLTPEQYHSSSLLRSNSPRNAPYFISPINPSSGTSNSRYHCVNVRSSDEITVIIKMSRAVASHSASVSGKMLSLIRILECPGCVAAAICFGMSLQTSSGLAEALI